MIPPQGGKRLPGAAPREPGEEGRGSGDVVRVTRVRGRQASLEQRDAEDADQEEGHQRGDGAPGRLRNGVASAPWALAWEDGKKCARRGSNPRPAASKVATTSGRTQPTPENRGRLSRLTAVRGIVRTPVSECVASYCKRLTRPRRSALRDRWLDGWDHHTVDGTEGRGALRNRRMAPTRAMTHPTGYGRRRIAHQSLPETQSVGAEWSNESGEGRTREPGAVELASQHPTRLSTRDVGIRWPGPFRGFG